MKNRGKTFILLLLLLYVCILQAQTKFLSEASPAKRVQVLWQHCNKYFISDQDSAVTHRFLAEVAQTADRLGDDRLKSYAQYFRRCYRLLFSQRYEQYFPEGDYGSPVAMFEGAKAWAQQEKYPDIVASCEHYIGQVYFRAGRYGAAFEHLLKAHEAFQKIGYENVPNASGYLYYLAMAYYWFEEWEKARETLLTAARYPYYVPRSEINTYNAVGLIYARKKEWDKAFLFYHKTIAKAVAYNDITWVGIASGNLGTVFLQKGQNDSALFYHRINYVINSTADDRDRGDAALTSLAMATAFIRKHQPDSALYYIRSGQHLMPINGIGIVEILEFRKRFLTALMELNKITGDYRTVTLLSDSLAAVKDSLQQILDAKI